MELGPLLATLGSIAAAFALVAWLGDHRRRRRSDLDAVGCMPWTAIFFFSLLAAVLLLGIAARLWFAN